MVVHNDVQLRRCTVDDCDDPGGLVAAIDVGWWDNAARDAASVRRCVSAVFQATLLAVCVKGIIQTARNSTARMAALFGGRDVGRRTANVVPVVIDASFHWTTRGRRRGAGALYRHTRRANLVEQLVRTVRRLWDAMKVDEPKHAVKGFVGKWEKRFFKHVTESPVGQCLRFDGCTARIVGCSVHDSHGVRSLVHHVVIGGRGVVATSKALNARCAVLGDEPLSAGIQDGAALLQAQHCGLSVTQIGNTAGRIVVCADKVIRGAGRVAKGQEIRHPSNGTIGRRTTNPEPLGCVLQAPRRMLIQLEIFLLSARPKRVVGLVPALTRWSKPKETVTPSRPRQHSGNTFE
eukprot:m.457267 g.457267  ORF g.457267 m.457267 type:complete len:348 (-) comp20331_c0_seq16:84-1127(-)